MFVFGIYGKNRTYRVDSMSVKIDQYLFRK